MLVWYTVVSIYNIRHVYKLFGKVLLTCTIFHANCRRVVKDHMVVELNASGPSLRSFDTVQMEIPCTPIYLRLLGPLVAG